MLAFLAVPYISEVAFFFLITSPVSTSWASEYFLLLFRHI